MHAPEASLVSRVRNMRLSLARCLCGGSRRVAFQITAELSTLGKVMRQRHILTLWLRYSDCRKAACPRLASDEDTDAEACRRHEVPFYEESYKVRPVSRLHMHGSAQQIRLIAHDAILSRPMPSRSSPHLAAIGLRIFCCDPRRRSTSRRKKKLCIRTFVSRAPRLMPATASPIPRGASEMPRSCVKRRNRETKGRQLSLPRI